MYSVNSSCCLSLSFVTERYRRLLFQYELQTSWCNGNLSPAFIITEWCAVSPVQYTSVSYWVTASRVWLLMIISVLEKCMFVSLKVHEFCYEPCVAILYTVSFILLIKLTSLSCDYCVCAVTGGSGSEYTPQHVQPAYGWQVHRVCRPRHLCVSEARGGGACRQPPVRFSALDYLSWFSGFLQMLNILPRLLFPFINCQWFYTCAHFFCVRFEAECFESRSLWIDRLDVDFGLVMITVQTAWCKVKGLDTWYSAAYMRRLVNSSASQSWMCQLIGMG